MRDRIIRAIAGIFVLTGLALGFLINEYWFILTAFVGVNLFQSSVTKWHFLEIILQKNSIEN